MKLVIDIPYEAYYTFKCELGKGNLNALGEIVANGIPYEAVSDRYDEGFRDGYAQCINDKEERKENNRLFQKGGAE